MWTLPYVGTFSEEMPIATLVYAPASLLGVPLVLIFVHCLESDKRVVNVVTFVCQSIEKIMRESFLLLPCSSFSAII